MNGIENITARINDETKQELEKIAAESKAECDKIKAQYKEIAQNEYWKLIAMGKEEADRRAERIRGVAQTEAKKQMLSLKQEMVSEAFALAKSKLLNLPEKEYTDFLVSLVVKGARTGAEQLIFSARDRSRYGKKVTVQANEVLKAAGKNNTLVLSEETRPISGGLILKDGSIEINCSVETILELRKNELATQVAKQLFD